MLIKTTRPWSYPELPTREEATRNKAVSEQVNKEDDDQSQHLIEQAIDYRPFGLNEGGRQRRRNHSAAISLEWPPNKQVQGRVAALGKATGEVDRSDKGIGADK